MNIFCSRGPTVKVDAGKLPLLARGRAREQLAGLTLIQDFASNSALLSLCDSAADHLCQSKVHLQASQAKFQRQTQVL